jgi:DNA/RNA-binding domain of Phe-tRNA-synthetase-like protein
VWRQCEKDKVTEKSKNIFIPIDVLGEVGGERGHEIVLELSKLIPRYLGGTLFSAILNSKNPHVEFYL